MSKETEVIMAHLRAIGERKDELLNYELSMEDLGYDMNAEEDSLLNREWHELTVLQHELKQILREITQA